MTQVSNSSESVKQDRGMNRVPSISESVKRTRNNPGSIKQTESIKLPRIPQNIYNRKPSIKAKDSKSKSSIKKLPLIKGIQPRKVKLKKVSKSSLEITKFSRPGQLYSPRKRENFSIM